MNKAAPLMVGVIFLIFFGLFLGGQVPIAITQDEVLTAVNNAIAEMEAEVDEVQVAQAVSTSIEKLEERQKRRLKFLVSAYFMIWLVFSLYVLRIGRAQSRLRQRLDQLESQANRSDYNS